MAYRISSCADSWAEHDEVAISFLALLMPSVLLLFFEDTIAAWQFLKARASVHAFWSAAIAHCIAAEWNAAAAYNSSLPSARLSEPFWCKAW
jgi:hypothetical protein